MWIWKFSTAWTFVIFLEIKNMENFKIVKIIMDNWWKFGLNIEHVDMKIGGLKWIFWKKVPANFEKNQELIN